MVKRLLAEVCLSLPRCVNTVEGIYLREGFIQLLTILILFKSCLSNTWVMRSCPFACTTSETKFNKTMGTHEASEYKKETAFFWFPVAPLLLPFCHCLSWAFCSGESVTGKATGLSKCDFCVCAWAHIIFALSTNPKLCPGLVLSLHITANGCGREYAVSKIQLWMCSGSKWWSIKIIF